MSYCRCKYGLIGFSRENWPANMCIAEFVHLHYLHEEHLLVLIQLVHPGERLKWAWLDHAQKIGLETCALQNLILFTAYDEHLLVLVQLVHLGNKYGFLDIWIGLIGFCSENWTGNMCISEIEHLHHLHDEPLLVHLQLVHIGDEDGHFKWAWS